MYNAHNAIKVQPVMLILSLKVNYFVGKRILVIGYQIREREFAMLENTLLVLTVRKWVEHNLTTVNPQYKPTSNRNPSKKTI